MVLLMKVTDSLDDDEPIYYDLDDPKQNDQFKKYSPGPVQDRLRQGRVSRRQGDHRVYQEGRLMACPYWNSRKIAEEYTVQTYDLRDEFEAINHIQCGKCGAYYSKTIRENPYTGKRKVSCTKGSYLYRKSSAAVLQLHTSAPHPRQDHGHLQEALT